MSNRIVYVSITVYLLYSFTGSLGFRVSGEIWQIKLMVIVYLPHL